MAVKLNNFTFQNLNSAAEVLLLKAEVEKPEYAGKTNAEIARILADRPQVANPAAAKKVPDTSKVNIASLLAHISTAELNKIPEDSLHRVGEAIKSLDTGYLGFALQIWQAKGHVTQGTVDAIQADLSAQVDDPSHPATVAGNSKLMDLTGRTDIGAISHSEIEASRGA